MNTETKIQQDITKSLQDISLKYPGYEIDINVSIALQQTKNTC